MYFYAGKVNILLFTLKSLARASFEICTQRKKCLWQEIECEKVLNVEKVSENVQNAKKKWLKVVVYLY